MTYRYLNNTGRFINAIDFNFQAVAENEISSMFDCSEDIAQTTISVIAYDKKAEAVASIEYTAFFWFSEGYSRGSDSWSNDAFHFELVQDAIALTDHDWDPTETTAEEVEVLEGENPADFWLQAEKAAAALCRNLEDTVRGMRYEDLSETVNLPDYALPYLFNADPSGLSEEDITNIDIWYQSLDRDGFSKSIDVLGLSTPEGPEPYFSSNPAFGLPAQCVKACIGYTPDIC